MIMACVDARKKKKERLNLGNNMGMVEPRNI